METKQAYIISCNDAYISDRGAVSIFWSEEEAYDHAKFLELTDYKIHACSVAAVVH